jgi:hypothetical protein
MPIKYLVSEDGHFIHAVAEGCITKQEFIEYEITHAADSRLKSPVCELLEVKYGAFKVITRDDILKISEKKKKSGLTHKTHRCAVVFNLMDYQAWSLARFYNGMAILHYPENVIVFGDVKTARIWLGVGNKKAKN